MRSNWKEELIHTLERDANTGKAELRAYLTATGSMKDSAAQLAPVTVASYVYPITAAEMMAAYRQRFGWDEFICRCAVAISLGFRGRWMYLLVYHDNDFAGMAKALLATDLPLTTVLDTFGGLYDSYYPNETCHEIRSILYEAVNHPCYLEELCGAARDSCIFGRQIALSILDGFTALPGEEGARAKAGILACTADSTKQIQTLLMNLLAAHPDWADDYAALLKSKKSAQRLLAASLGAKLGDSFRPALEEALAGEKITKVADALRNALGSKAPAEAAPLAPEDLAAQVLKGGKKRKVQWLLEHPLPALHQKDEGHTPVSEERRAALFVAYCELGSIRRSGTAAALAQGIDAGDLAALANQVFDLWLEAGAPSKTKWILPFAAAFGGPAMTRKLQLSIQNWAESYRGAIACDAVAALLLCDDPIALQILDSISRKFKFRQVKAAAAATLDRAAQELGITAEELADRIVPDLGFSAEGKRVFDYGPRSFTVRLTPTLELEITGDSGKTVKNLPSPGKSDDAEKAGAAYSDFKTMKKQIRATVSLQKARLEQALSALRCWKAEAWQALFVQNPIMHQFAISLIWGVYQDGRLQTTFRYMEDGSFTTVDEEEYLLPADASIGLAHLVELDAETLEAWRQQLEDYEITQSIQQLVRPVYRLEPGQEASRSLERFGGKKINGLALTGKLIGLGWYRGSIQDGGGYYAFYREDPALGMGVELSFSGLFAGGDAYTTVTVYDAVFYKAGTVERGNYCYDVPAKENIFPLGEVPARYYSEIVYQLERATAASTETNPNWKKEAAQY